MYIMFNFLTKFPIINIFYNNYLYLKVNSIRFDNFCETKIFIIILNYNFVYK